MTTSTAPASVARQHPIFECFDRLVPASDEVYNYDVLGMRTRREYERRMPGVDRLPAPPAGTLAQQVPSNLQYPPVDEEYFEWVDVLESVAQAESSYTMVELGAGYGRWIGRAACALRQRPGIRGTFVAVEAEPTHYGWLRQHMADNDIDLDACRLISAPIAASAGFVPFLVGDPDAWYGQSIDFRLRVHEELPSRARPALRHLVSELLHRRYRKRTVVYLPAITLREVLEPLGMVVDLIDLDIQGAEADVLESCPQLLSERVKRVHVEAHSSRIESRLREYFGRLGWDCLNDYRRKSSQATPFGTVAFSDGVQTWLNPAFASG